jgi:hypothetical protein
MAETVTAGADAWVRKVLRVEPGPPVPADQAHRLFSISIAISALRCLLTYVVLPLAGPLARVTVSDPSITIPVGVVALFFDVKALRRFWLADHSWRWWISGLYLVVMARILGVLASSVVDLA